MSVLAESVSDISVRTGAASVGALARRIKHDFFLSFRFSQGSPDMQGTLLGAVHLTYHQQLGFNTLALASAADEVDICSLGPPGQHIAVDDPRREAMEQWGNFHVRLQSAPMNEFNTFYFEIARMQIGRDNVYVDMGRPNRTVGDAFRSDFREYTLKFTDSHSDAYNSIFSGTRQLVRSGQPFIGLRALQATWEARHEGEKFLPEQFQAIADKIIV